MSQFEGQVALVTGSTSGIGKTVATRLAAQGAHVIITGRDKDRGERVRDAIRAAGGRADFVKASLLGEETARLLAQEALTLGGGHIDILVNNAGVFPFGSTAETSEKDFDLAYDVNVKTPFFLVSEIGPHMASRGKGAIVNVTTMVAHFGLSGMAVYG